MREWSQRMPPCEHISKNRLDMYVRTLSQYIVLYQKVLDILRYTVRNDVRYDYTCALLDTYAELWKLTENRLYIYAP